MADQNWPNPLRADQPTNDDGRIATFTKDITIYFGEFRLICITHVETQLLLLRSTGWQLHELIDLNRDAQLPYFTVAPDSEVENALVRQVDDIAKFGFDSPTTIERIDPVKAAIKSLVQDKTCNALLRHVTDLGERLADLWYDLLTIASRKLQELDRRAKELQDLVGSNDAGPDITAKLAEIKAKYDRANHDLQVTRANPRLTRCSEKSWFLFAPSNESDPPPEETIVFPGYVKLKWNPGELEATFLRSASIVAGKYRDPENNYAFSTHDRLAFHAAYYLLSQGQNEFNRYESRFLGTNGFREAKHQTYLSLTDPGQGHVFGTTTKSSWMNGVIVHVEHLERPARSGRDAIESYRMPSVREFARVCLHAGTKAPTTCFVGRPLQDSSEFKWDFIKVVDTVSSACSSMFNLGAAECKIAMGRLKTSEMVAYMRALKAHTLKNHRQYLSAAFNLNTPLTDDIIQAGQTKGGYIIDKMEIGRRAIELVALGGFEKITWDGASETYPSTPMLQDESGKNGQLSLLQAIELVHRAHSVGLTTYFSAGFTANHIPTVVYSGVDGVGIGGAQVIRGMDHTTGMHGEYQESRIENLIAARDKAAESTQGRAAKLLALLDQMFFEGSLNDQEFNTRKQLVNKLLEKPIDEEEFKALLGGSNIAWATDLFSDDSKVPDELAGVKELEKPWKWRAARLIRQRDGLDPYLKRYGLARGKEVGMEIPHDKWTKFTGSLAGVLEDEGAIHSLYMSNPWKKMRESYQKKMQVTYEAEMRAGGTKIDPPKFFMGEVEIPLKITPYGDPSSHQAHVIF